MEVDELCTSTVTNTPIIMADTGLLTNTLLENKSPAERPVGGGFRGVCGWSGWRVGVLEGVVGGVVGG